jgi:hypothetical protein
MTTNQPSVAPQVSGTPDRQIQREATLDLARQAAARPYVSEAGWPAMDQSVRPSKAADRMR